MGKRKLDLQVIMICSIIVLAFIGSTFLFNAADTGNLRRYTENLVTLVSDNAVEITDSDDSEEMLQNRLNGLGVKYGIDICLLDLNGRITLPGTMANEANQNLLSEGGFLAGYGNTLKPEAGSRAKIWLDRGTDFSRRKEFCEITYLRNRQEYLVVADLDSITMRSHKQQEVTRTVLLILVLLALLILIINLIRNYRRQLVDLATTDELTRLINRKSFVRRYEEEKDQGKLADASLFLLDVDFFKGINDTYGHASGDKTLSFLASKIAALAGPGELAGRWGGDEFIGVLKGNALSSYARLEKLRQEVAAAELEKGLKITVSVGITGIFGNGDLNSAVEEADEALYDSKRNKRNRVSFYSGERKSRGLKDSRTAVRAVSDTLIPIPRNGSFSGSSDVKVKISECILYAVNRMIPFAIGGGILIAIAFLIDGASLNLGSLSMEMRKQFGSVTPMAAVFKETGSVVFNFMFPVFAAFLACGIGGEEAFMAGFAGGYIAGQHGTGFLGAIFAGLFVGYLIRLLKNFISELPHAFNGIATVLIYPVLSLLLVQVVLTYLMNPVILAFISVLTRGLNVLSRGNGILFGAVGGAMMAVDMGGPVNKVAYNFATAALGSGEYRFMSAIMAAGMVPPCGIALSVFLFRKKFSATELRQAPLTLFMGLSFITEGAIPYLITDIFRVIPSCMAGAAVAGALSEAFGCMLMAPHGGIFVLPVIGKPVAFLASVAAGSAVTAVILGTCRSECHSTLIASYGLKKQKSE